MGDDEGTDRQDAEKFGRRLIKKKAGGRYAADLVLQLPARESGFAALHSIFLHRL